MKYTVNLGISNDGITLIDSEIGNSYLYLPYKSFYIK